MVALKIIIIIYLNSYRVCGEEVKGNEEIGGKKEEMNRNEELTKSEEDRLLIEMIPDLYRSYRKGVGVLKNSNETKSLRRIFKNNREYEIHVEKLKGVNGLKKHNLIIRQSSKNNPIIYVNNPVETKIPNAYLTLQDFKNLLTERVKKQKEKFINDYVEPILHKNKSVAVNARNIGITKLKRKTTTLNRTDKFQTESGKTVQSTDVKENENNKTISQENKNDGISQKSEANVTEKIFDTITTEVIEVTLSNLKESEQNQNNQNVENTSENVTEKITNESNHTQTADANEQSISKIEETTPLEDKIEENTTSGPTEDTPEVVTEQIEETSDAEVVTEETTSTTVQTTRTRLSKPLVWMGER